MRIGGTFNISAADKETAAEWAVNRYKCIDTATG
jgi:hypothetical protein